MPRYLYQARDGHGEMATGVIAASDLESAGQSLRSEGKFVIKLKQVLDDPTDSDALSLDQHARKVTRKDVIFFAHQISVMIETGVPISQALDCIVEQAANPSFKKVLREVTDHVQAGGELSVALRRFPRCFPNVMISLVKASEISGTMGAMLERVSTYLAKEEKTRRQARGALMYPLCMIGMALAVTVFLLAFVLPKFAKIYESRQAALPAPTQLLLFLSNSLVHYWYLWIGGAGVLLVSGYIYFHSEQGRRMLDWLKLNIPILKHLFVTMYVSRATRTMGTMIASGVSMLDTIAIVRDVTNNVYYQRMWDQVDQSLRQGLQLSDPLFESPLFPRSVVQMIRSGEKSGRLGQVLNRVADYSETEFDDAVKQTTQFIEPVMMVVMGSFVGFVAISLLLPIFSVGRVVSGN